jgi:hypothetical protein
LSGAFSAAVQAGARHEACSGGRFSRSCSCDPGGGAAAGSIAWPEVDPLMPLQAHDIQAVVHATLAEQQRLHNDDIDAVVLKTIATILTSFGIEDDDRKELRADFVHLRKWRKSVDAGVSLTFKVIIGTLVSGFLTAVWLGAKALLGK